MSGTDIKRPTHVEKWGLAFPRLWSLRYRDRREIVEDMLWFWHNEAREMKFRGACRLYGQVKDAQTGAMKDKVSTNLERIWRAPNDYFIVETVFGKRYKIKADSYCRDFYNLLADFPRLNTDHAAYLRHFGAARKDYI